MSGQKLGHPFKSRETLVNTLVHLMCMKRGPNVCVHEMSNDFYIGDVRSITKSAGQLKK